MATPTPSSYSCVSGGQINAGRHAWPAWRRAMAAGTVGQIGGNTWGSLDPKNNAALNPAYPGNPEWYGYGFTNKTVAWNGAAFDPAGCVIWQLADGGHHDHGGNDVYKYDLLDDEPLWVMVRPPTGCIGNEIITHDGAEATGVYADGRPRSIHTYNKPVYVPGIGPMLAIQGRCAYYVENGGTSRTLLCSETTGEFSTFAVCPDNYYNADGGAACYDSTRHRVWYRSAANVRPFWLDCATATWHNESTWPGDGVGGYKQLRHAPEIDRLLQVDDSGALRVQSPVNGAIFSPTLTGSPPAGFIGLSGKIGMDWDGSRLLLWHNSANTIVIGTLAPTGDVDADAWAWGQLEFTGVAPGVALANGTYGRFGYSRKLRGCFLHNAVSDKPSFFAIE